MSSGRPLRPSGMLLDRCRIIGPIRPVIDDAAGHSGGSVPSWILASVGTGTLPGATPFTRIECGRQVDRE